MKANELMIGDWVLYNETPQQILEISGIDDEVYLETDELVHQSEIQPIPLTEEILEKNGFEYKEGGKGLFGVTIAPRYLCKGVPFEVFCDGEPFAIWFNEPIDIKYIHQIQHALRLCEITREIII